MVGNAFYRLGRITGVQFRKAKWMWQSVAGSEADAIQAEHGVGRDMATVVLEETPRDLDQTTQALLDDVEGKLTPVVRNRLHRFQMTAVNPDQPTAFALPGGFIFVARSLVHLCDRDRDEVAFVLAHEMAHVIRRHAIDRLLQQKVVSALALASPGRGALASWIRQVGFQGLAPAPLGSSNPPSTLGGPVLAGRKRALDRRLRAYTRPRGPRNCRNWVPLLRRPRRRSPVSGGESAVRAEIDRSDHEPGLKTGTPSFRMPPAPSPSSTGSRTTQRSLRWVFSAK